MKGSTGYIIGIGFRVLLVTLAAHDATRFGHQDSALAGQLRAGF